MQWGRRGHRYPLPPVGMGLCVLKQLAAPPKGPHVRFQGSCYTIVEDTGRKKTKAAVDKELMLDGGNYLVVPLVVSGHCPGKPVPKWATEITVIVNVEYAMYSCLRSTSPVLLGRVMLGRAERFGKYSPVSPVRCDASLFFYIVFCVWSLGLPWAFFDRSTQPSLAVGLDPDLFGGGCWRNPRPAEQESGENVWYHILKRLWLAGYCLLQGNHEYTRCCAPWDGPASQCVDVS